MVDRTEFLLKLYEQSIVQGLHHQNQRSALSSLIFTLDAVSLGLANLDSILNHNDVPFAALIVLLGLFGALFTAKYHERYTWYAKQIDGFRDALGDATSSKDEINEIIETATRKVQEESGPILRFLNWLPAWYFWSFLHFLIALGGACFVWYLLSQGAPI